MASGPPPHSRTVDGAPCLVYVPGLSVVGLNPASGDTLWKYDFATEGVEQANQAAVAASPIVSGNRIFFPFHPDHGRGFSACIKIADSQPRLVWKSMKLAHWWLSPVDWKNHVIALDQGPAAEGNKAGALYCYDLDSGKLKWSSYEFGKKAGNNGEGSQTSSRRRPPDRT